MRILVQSRSEPNCLEQCLVRGLAATNCDYSTFVLEELEQALPQRIMRAIAPTLAYGAVNKTLRVSVDDSKPDVLWIFKGMEIYVETLRRIRRMGITLVNFNPDHPFSYFSRGTGNRNVRIAIPFYDLHLTYSMRIARELNDRYPAIQPVVVPFGHEVDENMFRQIEGEDEIVRACFIGTPDRHRKAQIERLVEAGISVDVYGDRWNRYLDSSPMLGIHDIVMGHTMLRTLRRYRLQLNFFRPHNADSHNMRTFEVPACGGIMFAEDSTEHRAFFRTGVEAFFFRTQTEMIEAARHLLGMPSAEADAVRKAARKRSMSGGR